MARPQRNFPSPDAIRTLADQGGRLALRVIPGARNEGLELGEGALLVKVRAKPQDGAANDAVVKMLSQALGCAPSLIKMLRGATGRDKLVQIPPQ